MWWSTRRCVASSIETGLCSLCAAGGFDAIWLLVLEPTDLSKDQPTPLTRVEKVWEMEEFKNVSPLLATESKDQGARIENLEQVRGLKDAVLYRS